MDSGYGRSERDRPSVCANMWIWCLGALAWNNGAREQQSDQSFIYSIVLESGRDPTAVQRNSAYSSPLHIKRTLAPGCDTRIKLTRHDRRILYLTGVVSAIPATVAG